MNILNKYIALFNKYYEVVKNKILGFVLPSKTLKGFFLQNIQKILLIILFVSAILMVSKLINNNNNNTKQSLNLEKTSQMLMHAQRLAKSASIIFHDKDSFNELLESQVSVRKNFTDLLNDVSESAFEKYIKQDLAVIKPFWEETQKATFNILNNKKTILEINKNYDEILSINTNFIDATEVIDNFIRQNNISIDQDTSKLILVANRLLYNTHLLYNQQATLDIVISIKKDLDVFNDSVLELKHNPKLMPIAEEINKLGDVFLDFKKNISTILDEMPTFLSIKESQSIILSKSEKLRNYISELQEDFSGHLSKSWFESIPVIIYGLICLLCLISLMLLSIYDSKFRAIEAQKRQKEAEINQQIEKKKNTANSEAILRLMSELQEIANGNLTQQATVDVSITGSIADFINYTVEELKGLVQRVKYTVGQVSEAFGNVQTTSQELVDNSAAQAEKINISSNQIQSMANRMQDVAKKTEQSMVTTNDAIKVTEEGQIASKRAISGMQAIRVQIQDTSKHIKRLGESSMQISDITSLIDNITQQTHILSINAAIQAANAGEAGKGFSVIAMEIQNLADKSAQATQQISQLINAIQSDVSSAGAAMEYSIQGVVEGWNFTDAMDKVLLKIQQTNQKLVTNMKEFADTIQNESLVANDISDMVKQLLSITDKTLNGANETSQSIQTLSMLNKKLEQSVSRFIVD